MPYTIPGTTHINGRRWTQVLSIWIPGLIQYRITEVSPLPGPTMGEIRWRRYSAGLPWYVEGSFGLSRSGTFTFVLTDIYVSLELYKDSVPTTSYGFLVEQIWP
jgi:hypothetical protein